MTQRRTVFTTAFALTAITVVAGGFSTANPVNAQSTNGVNRSTTTNVPSTIKMPVGGTRTKNAALPTTTTKPKSVTKPQSKPSKKKTAVTTVAPAGK